MGDHRQVLINRVKLNAVTNLSGGDRFTGKPNQRRRDNPCLVLVSELTYYMNVSNQTVVHLLVNPIGQQLRARLALLHVH